MCKIVNLWTFVRTMFEFAYCDTIGFDWFILIDWFAPWQTVPYFYRLLPLLRSPSSDSTLSQSPKILCKHVVTNHNDMRKKTTTNAPAPEQPFSGGSWPKGTRTVSVIIKIDRFYGFSGHRRHSGGWDIQKKNIIFKRPKAKTLNVIYFYFWLYISKVPIFKWQRC